MPIWMELLVLMLVAYVTGIAIGWIIWGREIRKEMADG